MWRKSDRAGQVLMLVIGLPKHMQSRLRQMDVASIAEHSVSKQSCMQDMHSYRAGQSPESASLHIESASLPESHFVWVQKFLLQQILAMWDTCGTVL